MIAITNAASSPALMDTTEALPSSSNQNQLSSSSTSATAGGATQRVTDHCVTIGPSYMAALPVNSGDPLIKQCVFKFMSTYYIYRRDIEQTHDPQRLSSLYRLLGQATTMRSIMTSQSGHSDLNLLMCRGAAAMVREINRVGRAFAMTLTDDDNKENLFVPGRTPTLKKKSPLARPPRGYKKDGSRVTPKGKRTPNDPEPRSTITTRAATAAASSADVSTTQVKTSTEQQSTPTIVTINADAFAALTQQLTLLQNQVIAATNAATLAAAAATAASQINNTPAVVPNTPALSPPRHESMIIDPPAKSQDEVGQDLDKLLKDPNFRIPLKKATKPQRPTVTNAPPQKQQSHDDTHSSRHGHYRSTSESRGTNRHDNRRPDQPLSTNPHDVASACGARLNILRLDHT